MPACLCKEIYGLFSFSLHMFNACFCNGHRQERRGALVMSENFLWHLFRVRVVILLSPLLTFIRLLLTGQTNKFHPSSDGGYFWLLFMLMIWDEMERNRIGQFECWKDFKEKLSTAPFCLHKLFTKVLLTSFELVIYLLCNNNFLISVLQLTASSSLCYKKPNFALFQEKNRPFAAVKSAHNLIVYSAIFFGLLFAKRNFLKDIISCQTQQEIRRKLMKEVKKCCLIPTTEGFSLALQINSPIMLWMPLFFRMSSGEKWNSHKRADRKSPRPSKRVYSLIQLETENSKQLLDIHFHSMLFPRHSLILTLPVYFFALNENMGKSFCHYYKDKRRTGKARTTFRIYFIALLA